LAATNYFAQVVEAASTGVTVKYIARLPLSKKLRLIIVTVVGFLLATTSAVSTVYKAYDYYKYSNNYANSVAAMVAINVGDDLVLNDRNSGLEILEAIGTDSNIIGSLLIDRSGNVFAEAGITHTIKQQLLLDSDPNMIEAASDLKQLYVTQPVLQGDTLVGRVVLQYQLNSIYETFLRDIIATVSILLLMMILVIPIARFLGSSLSRPIEALKNTMHEVSRHNNFSIRAKKETDDEIGFLVDQFNTMLDRLEDHDDKLKEYHINLETSVKELKLAKEKALQAASSKAQFLANMSHEIRTPMNGVLGMLELLRNSVLNSSQRDNTETAYQSATALLTIINDILDLSKIEAGKMALSKVPAAPADVIEEVTSMLFQTSYAKGIELHSVLEPEAFDLFLLDPTRLRQILINLVGNAIKFTHVGYVAIRCQIVTRAEDYIVKIEVEDTGIGIDNDSRDALFEAFGQADSSTTRRFGGTGLGLTISKQMVNLMDGQIGFDSTPNQGTRFYFEVPIEKAPEQNQLATIKQTKNKCIALNLESPNITASACALLKRLQVNLVDLEQTENKIDVVLTDNPQLDASCKKTVVLVPYHSKNALANGGQQLVLPLKLNMLANAIVNKHELDIQRPAGLPLYSSAKVLLVEDNPVNQIVASKILQQFGINCDKVDTGEKAVKRLQKKEYDLVFMDCQMPVMDGFEATRQIRLREKNQDTTHTTIVALTANAMPEDEKRCIDAGMDDYLAKPVRSAGVGDTLERWLSPQN